MLQKKRLIFHMISTVQMPGSGHIGSQIDMYNVTENKYVILAMDFQKHLSHESRKHGTIDHGKHKKRTRKQK